MSKLSELLPSGGGQNQVEFVASGTLPNGKPVILNSNGQVEVIGEVAAGLGSASVFESATVDNVTSTFDSNSNKFAVFYRDGANSNYGTCAIGSVSNRSISFGTPVVYHSGSATYASATFDSDHNKVVVAWYTGVKVGTINGNSISFGSLVGYPSNGYGQPKCAFDTYHGKVVIAYGDERNSKHGTAIVGGVSGTGITFGSKVVFESAETNFTGITVDSNVNRVVIGYQDNPNSSYGTSVVGTISGNSITFGSPVVFKSSGTQGINLAFDTNSNKVVIAYSATNGAYGAAIVGTATSGNNISFGSHTTFTTNGVGAAQIVFYSSSNKVFIGYSDGGDGEKGKFVQGTVSGTNISFNSPALFSNANTTYVSCIFDNTSNKVIFSYRNNANSNYGTSILFENISTNLTSTNLIGIAAEAASSGATAKINTWGGINEAQTSLTIGSDYYAQTNGTITTASASPAQKLGTAISATTINMRDLP